MTPKIVTSKNETSASTLNREGWLTEIAKQVEYLYKGFGLKPYRVTCGWPIRKSMSGRIGECHPGESSKGGFFEIFISPLIADSQLVAGTVCHELAHVAAGIDAQHGSGFVKVCRVVGLNKGKPRQVQPGRHLSDLLQKIIDKQGSYPHSPMAPIGKDKKPSSTVKLECPVCGCKVYISKKWLGEVGPPTCACGVGQVMEEI